MAFGRKKKDPETVNSNGVVANGKEAKTLIEPNGTGPTQNGRVHKDSIRSNQSLDFTPPDGGWGWVVCLASFWTNGTIFGILNTFGILYVKMLEEYDNGDPNLRFKTSWIGALEIFLTFFLSPVASILVDRIGIRLTGFLGALLATIGMLASSFVKRIEVMYFTYGILLGLGSSIIYNPSLVILGHYFKERLGLVNGLVAFGSGVFTIGLPFLMQWSLKEIGLSWTMRLLAAMLAVLMLGSLTWIPKFQARHTELDHYLRENKLSICTRMSLWMKKFLNVRIWKNKGYLVWAIASPVAFLGYFVPFVHLVKHTNDRMPHANAATLVMCIGITSAVSRLIFGKVADLPTVNRIRMQQCAFLVLGIVTACIPLAKDFWPLIIITLIMGMADGCFICLIGPIAFDLLGPQGAAQGIGCMLGIASIPMTAGPPLAGLMYDYLGSYDIAFYCGGLPPLLASVLLFLIPRHDNKGKGQPSVSMTKSMVAMSMENLDRIGEDDDDMAAHIKPQFQHLMDENYIRSARSWSMLNQQATGSMDFPISSRKTVSLTHLGPRRHSGGSRTHFVAKPSPLAMEDKKALRKSSEPICGSSEA